MKTFIKLKKLLEVLDDLDYVIIYFKDDENDKPSYKGCVLDVPWWMLKCYLYKDDEIDSATHLTYDAKTKRAAIVINLIEECENGC